MREAIHKSLEIVSEATSKSCFYKFKVSMRLVQQMQVPVLTKLVVAFLENISIHNTRTTQCRRDCLSDPSETEQSSSLNRLSNITATIVSRTLVLEMQHQHDWREWPRLMRISRAPSFQNDHCSQHHLAAFASAPDPQIYSLDARTNGIGTVATSYRHHGWPHVSDGGPPCPVQAILYNPKDRPSISAAPWLCTV